MPLAFWASASAGGAEKGHGCSGSRLAAPALRPLTASSHRTSVRSLRGVRLRSSARLPTGVVAAGWPPRVAPNTGAAGTR
eukprot:13092976-Alexandrium_andersonii.AAC.1